MMSSSMHTHLTSLNSVEFAALARAIASTTRQMGLVAPGFRCPTRIVGVDRTVRRFAGDELAGVVAVNIKDRPLAAVVADMIEGVIALNRLNAVESGHVRAALWLSLQHTAADAHVA